MIGPTGVGKTEIARRLANLADAPFIKVEATKFTEVGYVGREVDSIIRDLADIAIKGQREAEVQKVQRRAEDAAEDRVLDILLPPARDTGMADSNTDTEGAARQRFRKKLREGDLDDKEIEVELAAQVAGVEIFGPQGMEEITNQLQGMMKNMGGQKTQTRKLPIKEATKRLTEEEAGKLVNDE
jgi:ATP-dependent HslUV protease ATP-binding subunit HslU